MLTRRSTVAIVLLFAAGSIHAHSVAAKSSTIHPTRAAHLVASVFSTPLLAQSPLNWGRGLAAPEASWSKAAVVAPGVTWERNQGSNVASAAAVDSEFSVPVLAQLPLNWGQGASLGLKALPLQAATALPATGLVQAYRHALRLGFVAPGSIGATAALAQPTADDAVDAVAGLRDALVDLAMSLRNIPYVSGGDTPSTGFDCSGFVRYVFSRAIGMRLPANAASQFLAGLKVSRSRLKTGDLVFFHTAGKHRVSHVGIYLSDGRFIHAPTKGKSVEVSSLNETYWSRRFAGARRPAAIVAAANNG